MTVEYPYVILRNNARVVVLCGIRHGAPAGVYEKIQNDMDQHVRDGFTVLYEEVLSATGSDGLSPNGKRIFDFFKKCIFDQKNEGEERGGYVNQDEHIKYPHSARRVDLTLNELAHHLDVHGFRMDPLTLQITLSSFYKRWIHHVWGQINSGAYTDDTAHPSMVFKRLYAKLLESTDMMPIPFFMNKYRTRLTRPIVVDYRNQHVVDYITIGAGANLEGMYVVYGWDHVSGMTALLADKGWKPIIARNIDLHPSIAP